MKLKASFLVRPAVYGAIFGGLVFALEQFVSSSKFLNGRFFDAFPLSLVHIIPAGLEGIIAVPLIWIFSYRSLLSWPPISGLLFSILVWSILFCLTSIAATALKGEVKWFHYLIMIGIAFVIGFIMFLSIIPAT